MLDHLAEFRRTHGCGDLRPGQAGARVRLAGWVHRVRDHGGVIFLDLRDRSGLVQVVVRPVGGAEELTARARSVGSEWVLGVEGAVVARPDAMVNPQMPTGGVEVEADRLLILNDAQVPPFVLDDAPSAGEDLRLEYRYLDLRRPELAAVLRGQGLMPLAFTQFDLLRRPFWVWDKIAEVLSGRADTLAATG